MATPNLPSPISKLLQTLGMTREDLTKRSDQMRQFLTANNDTLPSRVTDQDQGFGTAINVDTRTHSRSKDSISSLSRSMSSTSTMSTSSFRDSTPPATPVKSEPQEGGLPSRPMDNMEMVIERQRRQRRLRKERGQKSRLDLPHPPSPSPSNASLSGSSQSLSSQRREDTRLSISSSIGSSETSNNGFSEFIEPSPVTPQKSKYYREHTMVASGSQPRANQNSKAETPTPTHAPSQAAPQNPALTQYYAYAGFPSYAHYVPVAYTPGVAGSTPLPITPQMQRTLPTTALYQLTPCPLPQSSPPPISSPHSSPVRVNLVSSPGPMGPPPEEDQYDKLPYKLPPGPYSDTKPDLSYAALVGRAILSSAQHRLTLQEIYEWITIVFPYYKRGETTWMNSIRHVLSTTAAFRKSSRDRSLGRTQWMIHDEDLECFKDGGFKKHLCKDYQNGNDGKTKGKARARKRADDDDNAGRKPKKARNQNSQSNIASSSVQPNVPAPPSITSHPLFPPTRPTTHHQPYYPTPMPPAQSLPADLIFPPLPAASAFNQVINQNRNASVSIRDVSEPEMDGQIGDNDSTSPSSTQDSLPAFPALSSASSFSSLPDLTPNRDSSSPPPSLPASSDVDINMHDRHAELADIQGSVASEDIDDGMESTIELNEEDIFNTALLGPVKFWGQSPNVSEGLQPGFELIDFGGDLDKGQDRKGKRPIRRNSLFPQEPNSPTLSVRTRAKTVSGALTGSPPASLIAPSTPPRSIRQHQLSSVRTPISHKGVHMSPSASLAHYKSHLDPPPPVSNKGVFPLDVHREYEEDDDPNRTPGKRGSLVDPSVMLGPPVTPKRLMFSTGLGDSPFRTPLGGVFGSSPFRTPGRHIFDPHDPRSLLDDELNRQFDTSPGGLFGKDRSRLLYDSPGIESSSNSHWW